MNGMYVVYGNGGWCLTDPNTNEIVAGPCDTIEELKQVYETRLYRQSKGWTP